MLGLFSINQARESESEEGKRKKNSNIELNLKKETSKEV
jgi:hypothetical protein